MLALVSMSILETSMLWLNSSEVVPEKEKEDLDPEKKRLFLKVYFTAFAAKEKVSEPLVVTKVLLMKVLPVPALVMTAEDPVELMRSSEKVLLLIPEPLKRRAVGLAVRSGLIKQQVKLL